MLPQPDVLAVGPKRVIPLIKPDLPAFEDVAGPFREILENGKITNFGRYVTAFEEQAAAYVGAQAVTVSSGTLGLLFTLQAIGIDPGQKVILPSFTFMATAQAVRYAGGIPVFVDIGDDLNIAPDDLDLLLKRDSSVGAVIGVHMYGLPCAVDQIRAIVERYSQGRPQPIPVLYDAAHAFGASRDGRRVGAFGTAEIFSLSVTKLLVTVEGGLVTSRDAELIRRIRKMRNYGIEDRYDAHYPGLNGKMSEFHAVIGLANLRRVEAILQERQR